MNMIEFYYSQPQWCVLCQGCIGEVRIGGLLLPYFSPEELNKINETQDYFALVAPYPTTAASYASILTASMVDSQYSYYSIWMLIFSYLFIKRNQICLVIWLLLGCQNFK